MSDVSPTLSDSVSEGQAVISTQAIILTQLFSGFHPIVVAERCEAKNTQDEE